MLLIVAGHETTVGLIGNAVSNLLAASRSARSSCGRPSLLPGAIEEVLRYEGPVERTLNRWAATDVELGGHTIRRGELVIAILDAADRDADALPRARSARRLPGRHEAPRVRPRQPLLPRSAARAARGRDRARDALPPPPRAPARRRAARSSSGARRPASAASPRSRSPGSPQSGSTTSVKPRTSRTTTCAPMPAPTSQRARQISPATLHLPARACSRPRRPRGGRRASRSRQRPAAASTTGSGGSSRPSSKRRAERDGDPVPGLLEHEDREQDREGEDHSGSAVEQLEAASVGRAEVAVAEPVARVQLPVRLDPLRREFGRRGLHVVDEEAEERVRRRLDVVRRDERERAAVGEEQPPDVAGDLQLDAERVGEEPATPSWSAAATPAKISPSTRTAIGCPDAPGADDRGAGGRAPGSTGSRSRARARSTASRRSSAPTITSPRPAPSNRRSMPGRCIPALAAQTTRLELGTLVSPVTFRAAAVLANVSATANEISAGRVSLGMGTGWMEAEHEAFGFPFPR